MVRSTEYCTVINRVKKPTHQAISSGKCKSKVWKSTYGLLPLGSKEAYTTNMLMNRLKLSLGGQ